MFVWHAGRVSSELRFRPISGPVIAAATWLIAILVIASIVVSESWPSALNAAPLALFACVAAYAGFWRPEMKVSDEGVDVINPFRKFRLAWVDVSRIDTRFALTFYSGSRAFRVWAAPAPGVMKAALLSRRDFDNLRLDTLPRPSDAAGTASGDGAEIIRRMMNQLSDRQWQLDDSTRTISLESESEATQSVTSEGHIDVRWNIVTIVLLSVCLVTALLVV